MNRITRDGALVAYEEAIVGLIERKAAVDMTAAIEIIARLYGVTPAHVRHSLNQHIRQRIGLEQRRHG